MNRLRLTPIVMLLPLLAACAVQPVRHPATAPTRSFHIRYEVALEELPVGEQLRLWIPVPDDDPHQAISNVRVTTPIRYRFQTERVHDNRMVYLEGVAQAPDMSVTVEYDVDRWENHVDAAALASDGPDHSLAYPQYRSGSRVAVITDEIRAIAARAAAGKSGTLAKARSYYDHVQSDMEYDKSGLGWGRGDTVYACDVGRGNCTDYHSYFIALCQAEGIPARFQIGLYGSYDRQDEEYQTGGYHCWAEFRVPGKGWVPVDISEGDKHPEQRDYFFGNHTDNRVTLSTGRDITLSPEQEGAPLNYFVDPYAEVAGREHPQVTKKAFWRDR